MQRSNPLGFSVYPSTWNQNKEQLASLFLEGSTVFTSLHIVEEMNESYVKNVEEMMEYLNQIGYRIIADVSLRTLEIFGEESLEEIAKRFSIDIIRVDFGFTEEEIFKASKNVEICLNASTITKEFALKLRETGKTFYAMHNFYPRPETGIDEDQFREINNFLKEYGFKILVFIPGDENLRGPIFEGLPTLEKHRNKPPYASFVDLHLNHDTQDIFIGDGFISKEQAQLIYEVIQEDIYSIPAILEDDHKNLYEEIFTIRADSPKDIIRFQESREYGTPGEFIEPKTIIKRKPGHITMDNKTYKRYSGEIQIIKKDLPKDPRVNVIGRVNKKYRGLFLKALKNNLKIKLVRA